MEENRDDEIQNNTSKYEIRSRKLKRELILEADFFGETKVKHKLTTYTWAMKEFKTLIKIQKHMDTIAFTVCDDSNIECFLSVDFDDWMSVHVTFCDAVPASYSYEIIVHIINEENLSAFHELAYVRDILKGQKVSFKNFLHIANDDDFNHFLVDGYLFLWCEISRMDSTFTSRNTQIELEENCISDDMPNLLEKQLLSDVTLIAGEREFQSHKCILAARSPVFLAMFQSDMKENQENKVVLEDADPECLQKLLEFVYSDKVDNVQKDTEKLLKMADEYDIKGLKLLCAQELCKNIEVDSSINILMWADIYDVPELKERTLTFIRSHLKDVLESSAYNDVIRKHPGLIKEIFCDGMPSASKRQKLEV